MNLQRDMFAEVRNWLVSGGTKTVFLIVKDYSEAKFIYCLLKWKASQRFETDLDFREIGFTEVKLGKVLEIEAPFGLKTIVFA